VRIHRGSKHQQLAGAAAQLLFDLASLLANPSSKQYLSSLRQ
jgi:hypothetical protein